ncbi:MAG: GNAT family N-acetyltransferase, partial [Gammaproteobacteria bacterium]|nr:GNAT family N-acetyltransferase [Gammaproteobacteria bacterium]
HAVGIMDGEQLAGYGVIRKCRQGYKIGPLFAETPELAESLFITLRNRVERAVAIYFDVPATNPAAISIAEKYKMQPVFETARMYTVSTPEIPIQKLFGVTSFELG